MSKIKRNILLNPGPATTTDSVKLAQIVPDICPREEEFSQLLQDITIELTKIVAESTSYTTVLFGGSGTAAVESVISSVVPQDGGILIINNGSYGQRMCQMAKVYDLPFIEYTSPLTDPIDLVDLEGVIQNSQGQISHLAVVHHETSTGLLNDISQIGLLCKKYNIDLIVDAMSSFAAVPIKLKEINISYLISSSSNQTEHRVNYLMQFLDQQKSINYHLNDAIKDLGKQMKKANSEQLQRYEAVLSQLKKQDELTHHLIDDEKRKEALILKVEDRLSKLEKTNDSWVKALENDEITNQAIIDQLSFQDKLINKISRKIDNNENVYEDIVTQQKKQEELQGEISEKLKIQEAFHQTILEQLEQQKALTQKIAKQLDSLKEFVYSKVSTIADKLEEGYHSTSQYFQGLFDKSGMFSQSHRNESQDQQAMEKEPVNKE